MSRGTTRLERRIAIALTLIVVSMVVVQGYLAYSTLEQQEDDLVDQIVASETRRLVDRLARGDELLATDGSPTDLSTRFRAWLLPASPPQAAAPARDLLPQAQTLRSGALMIHEGDRILHFLAVPTPNGRLVVEYDATEDEAFVYRYGAYLLAAGAIIILLAAIVSMAIARVVVAPLRRLAVQLSQWSPGTHPPVGRSDEETLLLEAFDAAQRRLEESHTREREFAANVRHEVRTPLTALRTDAEMLLLTQPVDGAGRERLLRMQATVDAIAADIESMHNLASARSAAPEPVNLASCLEDVWAGLQHRNVNGGLTLDSRLPAGEVVVIDRLALMTVLRNLLRNAIDHASPGRCTVHRTPDGIEVADDGPGIDPADLPRIFDRHFSRPRADLRPRADPQPRTDAPDRPAGHFPGPVPQTPGAGPPGSERGLGLAIARHTAVSRGWQLTATSDANRGTAFRLVFDEAG